MVIKKKGTTTKKTPFVSGICHPIADVRSCNSYCILLFVFVFHVIILTDNYNQNSPKEVMLATSKSG